MLLLEVDEEKIVELSDMQPLEGDKEKVKERKRLKILTPNKLLTGLLAFLAQIKAGNNSYKLKTQSDKFYTFCISIIKSPKIFTTI